MFLTETWLQSGNGAQVCELCPPFYDCFNQPRLNGHGGGPAAVFHKLFKYYPIKVTDVCSFEVLVFKIKCATPTLCVIIYHPPRFTSDFLAEFSDFLSSIVLSCELF